MSKKILGIVVAITTLMCFNDVGSYATDTTITTRESTIQTTTENTTVGVSSVNYIVSVSNDDALTGLETLANFYFTDMESETRIKLIKELTALVVTVVSEGGFSLDTFKAAFIEILVSYGIEITEDLTDAIVKYAVHYLNDDFEQEDEEMLLVWIGGSIGFLSTLFITSQQGGVHRA